MGGTPAGEVMQREMAEQPEVIRRLVDRRMSLVGRLRRELPDRPAGIVLLARGSSDNAAIYGRYLLEGATRRPVALAAPSLVTLYDIHLDVAGWIVVALSQSGQTAEIVDVAERLDGAGAHVVAVTNEEGSPLTDVADSVIGLDAGSEEAIPATKTFTAELVAMATIAEASGPLPWPDEAWAGLADAVATVLDDQGSVEASAPLLDHGSGLIVTGRGYLLSAALETALKLKECAGILAQGYSTADLRHGPIAVVEREFPVLVLSSLGRTAADTAGLVGDLRDREATVIEAGQRDGVDLPLPPAVPEGLSPVLAAVRGQQLALELARRRNLDPDNPEGLSKVTGGEAPHG